MKRALSNLCILAALALSSCSRPPVATEAPTPVPEMKNGHPVVHVPPVETRPFEDGYAAGYEYGRKQAKPGSGLPTEEESGQVAHQQAIGQPDRWERGFAEGYTDGVRNVVTGQK